MDVVQLFDGPSSSSSISEDFKIRGYDEMEEQQQIIGSSLIEEDIERHADTRGVIDRDIVESEDAPPTSYAVAQFVDGTSAVVDAAVSSVSEIPVSPAASRPSTKIRTRSHRRIEEDDDDDEWLPGEISIPPTKKKSGFGSSIEMETLGEGAIIPGGSTPHSSSNTGRLVIRIPARMIVGGNPHHNNNNDKSSALLNETIENLRRQVVQNEACIRERDDQLVAARKEIKALQIDLSAARSAPVQKEFVDLQFKIGQMKKEEQETAVIYHECAAKLTECSTKLADQTSALVSAHEEIRILKIAAAAEKHTEVCITEVVEIETNGQVMKRFMTMREQLFSLDKHLFALHITMLECIELKYYSLAHRESHIKSLGNAIDMTRKIRDNVQKAWPQLEKSNSASAYTPCADVGLSKRQLEEKLTLIAELQAEVALLRSSGDSAILQTKITELTEQVGVLQDKNVQMMRIFKMLNDGSNDDDVAEEETIIGETAPATIASLGTAPIISEALALDIAVVCNNLDDDRVKIAEAAIVENEPELKTELENARNRITELDGILLHTAQLLSAAVQRNVEKDDILLAATRKHDSDLLIAAKEIGKKDRLFKILTEERDALKHNLDVYKSNLSAADTAGAKEADMFKKLHSKCVGEIKSLKEKIASSADVANRKAAMESDLNNLRERVRDAHAEVARLNSIISSSIRRFRIGLFGELSPLSDQVRTRITILKTSLSDMQLNFMKSKSNLLCKSPTYTTKQENGTLIPTYVQIPMDSILVQDPNATLSDVDIEICPS